MFSAAAIDRNALRAELDEARRQTDALFASLTDEGLYARPIAERHRFIFYVGHLEVFDWNLLWRDALKRPSKNAEWEQLFAFGIDPTDGQLPSDTPADWPSRDTLKKWVAKLRADVDEVFASAPLEGWLEGGWAMHIAIEHRQMHAETLAYLLHQAPHAHKRGHQVHAGLDTSAPSNTFIDVPAGRATLGRPRATEGFLGWDNEYEQHTLEVPAFKVQKFAVSNADFLRFVDAGGYGQRAFWNDDDWKWKEQHHVTHPAFWERRDGRWFWKAMFDFVPLPPSWPAWVSLAEARAYAAWAKLKLPTEAQFHRAAYGDDGRHFPWGNEAPRPGVHGAFGFSQFDPSPVGSHPAGESPFGIHDLLGNGWQWTRTPFEPFKGFTPLPFYLGYSANFFDGKHFVMKGGGPRTATALLRRSFRNWFQPHYPYVHATFRCVED